MPPPIVRSLTLKFNQSPSPRNSMIYWLDKFIIFQLHRLAASSAVPPRRLFRTQQQQQQHQKDRWHCERSLAKTSNFVANNKPLLFPTFLQSRRPKTTFASGSIMGGIMSQLGLVDEDPKTSIKLDVRKLVSPATCTYYTRIHAQQYSF